MKKFALIILIVVMAILFTACTTGYYDTIKWEKRVIEAACNDLGIPTRGVKLQFYNGEYEYLDGGYVIYRYVMTIPDGSQHLVSAFEFRGELHCYVSEKPFGQ